MSITNTIEKPTELSQLFAQFLKQRATAWSSGHDSESTGEIEPFQSSSFYPIDARLAWQQALESATHFLSQKEASVFNGKTLKSPADWPNMVRNPVSMIAIPFCLGNYPQMLRSVTPLLNGTPLTDLRPSKKKGKEEAHSFVGETTKPRTPADALLSAAFHRQQQQFQSAGKILADLRRNTPADWDGLLINEEAALCWHVGDSDKAQQLWDSHPEKTNPVVLFNRGLARLFSGKADEAGSLLTRAADGIAPSSPWNDLAQLYRSVVNVISG